MSDFWVFGYGSLMWNPGFQTIDKKLARIDGLHRALCIYSWVHRGTKQSPGLVLGLDEGGACEGMAFKVSGDIKEPTIQYLRERELVTNVYLECTRDVNILETGESVEALVYKVDRSHEQYASGLSIDDQTSIIADAVGGSGNNREYVYNTVDALKKFGICDEGLEQLATNLRSRN